MENTNKPQWLIDAEIDINEFHETKHGKMSQKQINYSEASSIKTTFKSINKINKHQSNAASISGKIAKETGQFASIKTKEHQTNAGKKAGAKNVENGTWKKAIEAGKESLKIEHTCPHCNKPFIGLSYRRWHGDNCKLNSNKNK